MKGPTYSELDSLYRQLSVDFERLLKKTERYEYALKEIASDPTGVSAYQANLAQEALEPRE